MILTCPSCTSRFLLSAQALAPEGRKVKCSSCDEEWFQEPDTDELLGDIEGKIEQDAGKSAHDQDAEQELPQTKEATKEEIKTEAPDIEDIPDSVKPVPETDEDMARSEGSMKAASPANKKKDVAGYLAAAAVFFVLLGGLIAMKPMLTRALPSSAGFYHLLGMSVEAPGQGLVFDQVRANLTQPGEVEIEGVIVNLKSSQEVLPSVEVSIRNEAGDVVENTVLHPPQNYLASEASLPFKSKYLGDASEADHVQLRFVLADKPKAEEKPEAEEHTEEAHEAVHGDEHDSEHHGDTHSEAPHDDGHHPKNVSKDADNIPAPHADDHAAPHASESH